MKSNYYLHGHYPLNPKQYFTQMSEYVSEKEEHDNYGKGEAIENFENELAVLFGLESCIFLPSGTMAQQMALRIWTDNKKNKNVAFHPNCHLEIHEHNSYKVLHNLNAELIGEKDKLITIHDLKSLQSSPAVVLLELPQREIGGQLPGWEDLKEQVAYLKSKDIIVHLDGARVWECTTYYKKSLKQITSLFDSTYISFYKGIGALSGAALLGPSSFIKDAHIWNRRHGGNLYKSSPLYISARYNLKNRIDLFTSYYDKTIEIYNVISKIDGINFNPSKPQVNMFHLYISGEANSLVKKAMGTAIELGIEAFPNISPTKKEGISKMEWYVGDATLDVPISVIEKLFKGITKN